MLSKTAAILLLILATVSCQKTQIDLTTHTDVLYDTTLTFKQGDNFEITLKENPTTGYIWQILPSDLATQGLDKVLKVRGSKYEQDPKSRGAVGHGGVRKFQFHVIGEGQGNINFFYGRSWEIQKQQDQGLTLESFIQKIVPLKAVSRKQNTEL